MKAFLSVLAGILILASCDIMQISKTVNHFGTMDEARTWISIHVHYVTDIEQYGKNDVWQVPELTERVGKGDCEDYALLLMAYLKQIGIESELVVVTDAINPAGEHIGPHAWAKIGDALYSPEIFSWTSTMENESARIDYVYSYNDAMLKANTDSAPYK